MSTSKTIFNPLLSANLQKISTTAEGIAAATREPTGFEDPDNLDVSYSFTNRTVTLTHTSGNIVFWYRGKRYTQTSPWTSAAHDDTTGAWFLTINGDISTEAWSQTPWTFDVVMVCYVNFTSGSAVNTFALREDHGLMQWQAHEELHKNIGTYWVSGLGITAGTIIVYTNSTAPTSVDDNTPGVDAGVIADEDIHTAIPLLPEGTYTTAYRNGAAGDWVFDTTDVLPYFEVANAVQYNQNTGSTWQLTPLAEDAFVNVYDFAFPVTSDSDSQKYRHVWITGQATYTSLASALLEFPRNLELGALSSIAPEFVAVTRITYQYNTTGLGAVGVGVAGRCKIMAATAIRGSRANQTAVSGAAPSDHGNLSGLGDDDHSQYELIAGRAGNVVTQSSNFSQASGVILYNVDTSGGNINVTLLDPATVPGKLAIFLNTSTNNIIFGGHTIGGVSNFTIDGNERLQIVSDGSVWKQYARKNMSFWKTGITYCKDVLIEVTEEGFEGLWRCISQHTAAAAFSTDVATRWDYVAGERTARWFNVASHGFAAGDWIYRKSDSTWAKAKADVSDTAEVVGVVSGAVTNYFLLVEHGYWKKTGAGFTDSAVQFLSAATEGAQTETEPSVVGQVSVPLGHAISTEEMMVRPMRGTTVGGTNVSTVIPLTVGGSAPIQNVSTWPIGGGGKINGTITVLGPATPQGCRVEINFQKRSSTSYEISAAFPASSIVGTGSPLAATINETSGVISITLPTITGATSASITFSIDSAALGATLPLAISASNVLGSTSGVAPATGVIGEIVPFTSRVVTGGVAAWKSNTSELATLTAGIWQVCARISFSGNTAANVILGVVSTNSSEDGTGQVAGVNIVYTQNASASNSMALPLAEINPLIVSTSQAVYAKSFSEDAAVNTTIAGFARRIG